VRNGGPQLDQRNDGERKLGFDDLVAHSVADEFAVVVVSYQNAQRFHTAPIRGSCACAVRTDTAAEPVIAPPLPRVSEHRR
jgi:hypothetical protein